MASNPSSMMLLDDDTAFDVAEWWRHIGQLAANCATKAAVASVDPELTTNPKNHLVVQFSKATGFVGHLGPKLSP